MIVSRSIVDGYTGKLIKTKLCTLICSIWLGVKTGKSSRGVVVGTTRAIDCNAKHMLGRDGFCFSTFNTLAAIAMLDALD